MLGEEPDARRCVAYNISLRMKIFDEQLVLQRELKQSEASATVAGWTFCANAQATASALGIPKDTDARSSATAAQRIGSLRREHSALRWRIAVTTDVRLPPPPLAFEVPPLHVVVALPAHYVATPLDLFQR